MTTKFLQFLLALVLCATLAPGLYAKGNHGGGGDKQDKHKDKDKAHDRDEDRDHADRDHDRDGDHDRDSDKARPAGWDKGKKKGWGGCDVPPGQVKKLGCHPNSRHHVAHRDRDRDRDRVRDSRDRDGHISTARHTTTSTSGSGKTTTTANATHGGRRKVFDGDGTWHYEGATTTTTKK